MSIAYPEGIDCVWIASDRDGHVGAFVTGGSGPIPTSVLSSENVSIEDIEELVCSLPRVSTTRLLVKVQRPESFLEMAERGLFVYDWSDVHRTARESLRGYEQAAVPVNPLPVGGLNNELANLASDLRLNRISFSEQQVLDVRKYVSCLEAE